MTRKRLLLNISLVVFAISIASGCKSGRNMVGPSDTFEQNESDPGEIDPNEPDPDEPDPNKPIPNKVRYYGYYFVEEDGKNLNHVHEVSPFTNIINFRYEDGPGNKIGHSDANRIKSTGVKVMLQISFGDSEQTLFVNTTIRRSYLRDMQQHLSNLNFISSIAYIAVAEEWYVLISQGYYDSWPIFQGKTREQKFAIAKQYLEQIIDDVHNIFPGIPTVIVENILPYPAPPSNVDVLGIDAYYIPNTNSCDAGQKSLFNDQVISYYDAAKSYGKPIIMVAPSFISGPWRMLSKCQMQWYVDLAQEGEYEIESFLWFTYGSFTGLTGVRNFPDLVSYQQEIGHSFLENR